MFSGIVTECLSCLHLKSSGDLLRVTFLRPPAWENLKEGDSVSVDGVCLTVETLLKNTMAFAIGPETLKITKWRESSFQEKKFNLEQALSLNQSLGGHFVTGHVDGLAQVIFYKKKGECREMTLQLPKEFQKFFWKKGYITLNGASLTVNDIKNGNIEITLIPKTLEKTNLSSLREGDQLNFEVDLLARLFVQSLESVMGNKKNSSLSF